MRARLAAALASVSVSVFGALAATGAEALAAPAPARPPPPAGWPSRLASGTADEPGGARRLGQRPGIDARYQYLAGGVDTRDGWRGWNPDGTFVSRYVAESRRAGLLPVLTYYQLLQSRPGRPGGEAERDLANLADAPLMRAYYDDFRLAVKRAREGGGPVVLHVEPDLWGHVQQAARGDDAATVPAAVARSGDPALQDLPDTAAGFAQALVRLRDREGPEVRLAWHLSTWGAQLSPTGHDLPARRIDEQADRAARFYGSLGADFDLIFNDVADRDDGFRQKVLGEARPFHRWGSGDVGRHLRYLRGVSERTREPLVLWQLPLGNRSLPNTFGRFRDNRVDLLLGSRRTLRALRAAGVVGLLFGAGADGCTTPATDGGRFYRLARRAARAPIRLR